MIPRLAAVVLCLVASSSVGAAPADVRSLFKRAPNTDVGSAAWIAQYPPAGSTPKDVPQLWLDKLDEVTRAGLIPSPSVNPVAALAGEGTSYPGLNGGGPEICSSPMGCIGDDMMDAPPGYIGISHDDGPLPNGVELYQFFSRANVSATHFYIGGNVLSNWQIFLQARALPNQHFASHTWSHPRMTSLSNRDVVSELGWTMQILADSNFGRIPMYWRPSYGDVDNRVRAIAQHVFGLRTVIWNRDSEDWQIGSGITQETVMASVRGFIQGPKTPGLLILQHELSSGDVNVFTTLYPEMLAQGWKVGNIPEVHGLPLYKNGFTTTSPPLNISLVANASYSSSTSILPSSTSIALSVQSSSVGNAAAPTPTAVPVLSRAQTRFASNTLLLYFSSFIFVSALALL